MQIFLRGGVPIVYGTSDAESPEGRAGRKALLATYKPKRKTTIVRSKVTPKFVTRSTTTRSKELGPSPTPIPDERSRPQLLGDLARRLA